MVSTLHLLKFDIVWIMFLTGISTTFLEIFGYTTSLPLSPTTSSSHARSSRVVGSADHENFFFFDHENFEASAPLGRDSWAYALSDRSGLLVSASLPFDLYFVFPPEEPCPGL